MALHPGRCRSRLLKMLVAAVSVMALSAGCATGGVAGNGSRPTTVVTPGSGGGSTQPGTTVVRPAIVNGPLRTAGPIVTVNEFPGFYCTAVGTLVPALVVYDDGSVLSADGLGASCEKVPAVSAGWVDPASVRARLDAYFGSAASKVDMGSLPVSDLGSTALVYVDPDGRNHKVSAYGLGSGFGTSSLSADETAARALLDQLIRSLLTDSVPRIPWAPQHLSVLRSSTGQLADPSPAPVAWPLTLTSGSRRALANLNSCLPVTGRDVTTVLRAHGSRHAQAIWTVDGKQVQLSIGIVLPGWKPCANS